MFKRYDTEAEALAEAERHLERVRQRTHIHGDASQFVPVALHCQLDDGSGYWYPALAGYYVVISREKITRPWELEPIRVLATCQAEAERKAGLDLTSKDYRLRRVVLEPDWNEIDARQKARKAKKAARHA